MNEKRDDITFTIDEQKVTVPKGTTVYKAATQMGIDIPIFCYQDRMPPFGACRVCLVEVEKMPKLQTSCTLEATEGMVVKTQTQLAKEGRESIIELLLINHPLDCPICDKGGECPLQDQTQKFGPERSRFYEEKRHFKKPIPLGPVLMLDRERCIVCARCTRFGEIVAGDHALEFIERGFKTEVGTPGSGPAESKFIGNTIMICPVGALTSQVYRFRARPWDNDSTPTTCTLCPVGCSMILDARDGEIMRTRSRENPAVNDIWLCDKGWFGYEFTTHGNRLTKPMIRRNEELQEATWVEALQLIASHIRQAKPGGKIAALGGNPLTAEENYLYQKLFREGAGVNNLDHRVGMPIIPLEEEGILPGMEMAIGDSEQLSYAYLLGLDITEEFPVIWLRLRQAILKGARVVFIGSYAPEVAAQLNETILHAPGEEQEAFANIKPGNGKGALFVGSQYLASANRKAILAQLLKIKQSAPNLSLNLLEGRGNSMGARYAGMRPDLGAYGRRLDQPGLNVIQVLEKAAKEGWDYLHVAGADPASKYPSKLWQAARSRTHLLVVQDLFLTETARQADVVLPVRSYVEKDGSFINIEGRVQALLPGKEIPEGVWSDGEVFRGIAELLNLKLGVELEFMQSLHERIPRDQPQSLQAEYKKEPAGLKAAFAPVLFDRGVRMKHDTHLVQLAKEPRIKLHPSDAAKQGIESGMRLRVNHGENAFSAKVSLDEKVAKGTVVLPLGFRQVPVHDLASNLLNGMPVELSREGE